MCRIAGIIDKKQSPDILQRKVTFMCNSMQHGGPDDFGVNYDADAAVCLGNRRLAVLDLTMAGRQPMLNPDSTVAISYNGEIYNFKEIRNELNMLGVLFQTQTDTEVVLKAYCEWGEKAFEKLNGIFAFALHDRVRDLVYLVRDPNGVKPLYFSHQSGKLIFASEVKAFQHADDFQNDQNRNIYFLAFGHIPEPYTTLKNVYSLSKGNFLKYNLNTGSYAISSYYQFKTSSIITNEREAIRLIKHELNASIKRQLISDTNIGVLFSGGLDSSIIASLASRYTKDKLACISANFDEIDFSEHKQRESLLKKMNSREIEQTITYRDFVQNFDSVLNSMDQPSNDGINTWFVCKTAKENGLKSVLSGLGADELFGGYPSFDRIHKIQNLNWLSKSTIKSTRFLKNNKYKRLYYLSMDSPIGEYLCLRGVYSPDIIAELLDIDMKTVMNCLEDIPFAPQVKHLSNEIRASWFEFNMYMQNQLLKDTDFMSMSHGVEVRVPFLDRNFVNLVFSISNEIKFSYEQKKHLLIEGYKDGLPAETWNRSKMGFTFPFQEWMRKNKAISAPELYHNKRAKALMEKFKDNQLHWSSAFSLYRLYHAS
ncbi:asparagine synthase (glutamine-hydrolyzing) [Pedobacter rhodius]|uniref:asparagine synthase (glutamine-hydrolyzing) n=1 Tax=Pedobacter rhodius TaxID=3004098 RepID=A0ABT4KSP9_9SPHI|nr:asparagine synthase (glutamine-hydrolyzing) [Pedobacter sp. SJ11]MCZ4221815.1 asparagine synthase (glutamine-hydrolyzing) [Pedobacter sp. SJ11]